MLIQFSVKNYRTFKDKASLSLIASNYDKETRETENVIVNSQFNLRLLKSAVVYGANASGKSKLLIALSFMKSFINTSSKDRQQGDDIDVEAFKLNSETEHAPSEFEVIFIHNDTMYRYGFEVDTKQVISEWLYYRKKAKEVELFYRDGQNFDTHDRNFSKGKAIIKEGLVRDNALLLSVAAQFNDPTCIEVLEWFGKLKLLSGLKEDRSRGYTVNQTTFPDQKRKILDLLKAADLGIQDFQVEKLDPDDLPDELPDELKERFKKNVSFVFTTHQKVNGKGKVVGDVDFSMDMDESSGTRKFFALTGPILDVLENGHILVVDELDSRLHPNLVCKIVSLFNSAELNKNNAQLIFNTHDTNLLHSGLFRRDQVWFTEKNKLGEASLYSLADFKSHEVKKTESFEENYIRGKYGAVPFLGFFDELIKSLPRHENEKQKG